MRDDEGWFFIPNISGQLPMKEPPKDRPIIVRNFQNRREGAGIKRFMSEHMVFWDGEQFSRLSDDLLREPVFTFFHQWREFGD